MIIMAFVPTGPLHLTLQDVDRSVEAAIVSLRRMPYQEYLRTAHWQRQRTYALERAGQLCELCAQDHELEVHHRTYARVGFERPDDLVVLCRSCHRDHHRALILRAIRTSERPPLKTMVDDFAKRQAR